MARPLLDKLLRRRPALVTDTFLDAAPLIDRELRLVAPTCDAADDFLASACDPRSAACPATDHDEAYVDDLLRRAPGGHQRTPPATGCHLAYRFWMQLTGSDPLPFAGTVTLRIGDGESITQYVGHLGYLVFAPCRGRDYSERAVRLLLPLAAAHGLREVVITCNPENHASRRIAEKLGASLQQIVDVPADHPLREQGDTRKCRYVLPLAT